VAQISDRAQYFIDAQFLNPNNQHLDTRDIPNLTT
jgi:hypothetical protein